MAHRISRHSRDWMKMSPRTAVLSSRKGYGGAVAAAAVRLSVVVYCTEKNRLLVATLGRLIIRRCVQQSDDGDCDCLGGWGNEMW